jgi:hypothetical protein
MPSQYPLLPQAAAPSSLHCESGSCPAGILAQDPSDPTTAHDWQAAEHAVAQQIDCSQWALTHSLAAPQGCPFAFLPQDPAMHVLVPWHSLLPVQLE